MDWDSKLPPWEMTELEQSHMQPNSMPILNTISAGSSVGPFEAMAQPMGLTDCSIDLKLGGSTGRLVDLGVFHKDQPRSTTSVSAPSAAKRARGPINPAQPTVRCSVDGCGSDLSNCRDYHMRHKVCEAHSKTPIVLVGGQEQRFCQQCSRFHMLSEFDEVKRSCRKRLDGHNRRRRKPQSDTDNLFSASQQGANFSNFPSIFPTSLLDSNWMGPSTKASQQNLISHHYLTPQPHQPFSLTFPQSLKQTTKRFPFLNEPTSTETRNGIGSGIRSISLSVSQPSQKSIPISASVSSYSSGGSGNANRMHYSEHALSLLSSPPPSATVAASASNLAMGPNCQPLFSGYSYGAATPTGLSMEEVHEGNVFLSNSNSNSNSGNGIAGGMVNRNSGVDFHGQEMYNVGHEGPSIEESSSQPPPFWHH